MPTAKAKVTAQKRKQLISTAQITSPRDKSRRKDRASSKQSSGTSKKKYSKPPKTPVKRTKLASNSNVSPATQPHVEVDPQVFVKLHVLLSTDIYRDVPVPAEYVDHCFRYSVESYNVTSKTFTLKYERQTIREDGLTFKVDEKSTSETLSQIGIETVEKGLDLFQDAISRITKHNQQRQLVVKLSLKRSSYAPQLVKPEDVDVSDIDKLAVDNPEKGYLCEEILTVSFQVVCACTILKNILLTRLLLFLV